MTERDRDEYKNEYKKLGLMNIKIGTKRFQFWKVQNRNLLVLIFEHLGFNFLAFRF